MEKDNIKHSSTEVHIAPDVDGYVVVVIFFYDDKIYKHGSLVTKEYYDDKKETDYFVERARDYIYDVITGAR